MCLKTRFIIALLIGFSMISYVGCQSNVSQDQEPLPKDKVTIYVISDIHYLAEGLHDGGRAFQIS